MIALLTSRLSAVTRSWRNARIRCLCLSVASRTQGYTRFVERALQRFAVMGVDFNSRMEAQWASINTIALAEGQVL